MKHINRLIQLALLSTLCIAGCKSLNPFSPGPASVSKSFYMDCNAGDYTKAEGLLTVDAKNFLSGGLGAFSGGIKGICDKASRNGSITSVDTESEETRGEGATVKSKIHYKDGSTLEDATTLQKVDGSWLLTIGQ
jgi:hypothetical protein